MRNRNSWLGSLALMLSLCFGSVYADSETPKRTGWKEIVAKASRSAVVTRPSPSRGDAPEPPKEIIPEAEKISASSSASSTNTQLDEEIQREREYLQSRVRSVASSYANWRVREHGLLQSYRAGVWRGLRDAMHRDGLIDWDYMQGRLAGRLNPEARKFGREEGRLTAEELALAAASEKVAQDFRQLDAFPELDHSPPAVVQEFDRNAYYETPRLDTFFELLDFAAFGNRRLMRAFNGTSWHGRNLYECDSISRVVDREWNDPQHAWNQWKRQSESRSILNEIRFNENRTFFESAFKTEFARALSHRERSRVARAWHDGWDDGFDYGAFVRFEHAFKDGFANGSAEARANAASDVFAEVFPLAYQNAYERAFEDWASTPKIEIEEVVLRDGNEDGVFEPDESFVAHLKLVNFGGAGGSREVLLDGQALSERTPLKVNIAARSRLSEGLPVPLKVSASAPVRVETLLTATIDGHTFEFPFVAAWPLEFFGSPGVEVVEAATGRAWVSFQMQNISRVPQTALLEVYSQGEVTQDPIELAAGERRNLSYEVTGFIGSALLDGSSHIEWKLLSKDRTQDHVQQRFPRFATDLSAPFLTDYLVSIANGLPIDVEEQRRVEQLVWDRMQVDWQRAIRANGNPYKRDLKGRGAETELGNWIRHAERSGGRAPTIWSDISQVIHTRAKQLPGVHPRLRKALKKLSRQLS